MSRYHPLRSLYLSRIREFYRQPARLFWVYGFPTVLAIGLGIAFRNKGEQPIKVDLIANGSESRVEKIVAARATGPKIEFKQIAPEQVDSRLRLGRTPLAVEGRPDGSVVYHLDSSRPEAQAARAAVDDAIQRAAGRVDPVSVSDVKPVGPGSEYVHFLIPGLIGQNTMGGGLWGVGFLIVNFRIGKLLKRFMATPMPRRDFLLAILGARLTFLVPDVAVLLAVGVFLFQMPIVGSLWLVMLIEVVGALAFAGIGLLIASRADTTEAVSGLINLVMLPMWIFSGLFFSAETFPAAIQPFVQALPLTQLLNALRRVMLEGATLFDTDILISLGVLALWGGVSFFLALRSFKWS
ncbi:MAG: ABC transporter permease [Isosphaeraceae bacterium]|nr:ABC transporter permease [Isosphaeraceae bacterium]